MEAMRANVPHLGELVRPQARSENKASHALSMATVRRDDVVRWKCRVDAYGWLGVRCAMTSIPIACYGLQSHLGVTIFVLASSVSDSIICSFTRCDVRCVCGAVCGAVPCDRSGDRPRRTRGILPSGKGREK